MERQPGPFEGMNAAQRLTARLKTVGAPYEMIKKASQGYYGDFSSKSATPLAQLAMDCRAANLHDVEIEALRGYFHGR